jgi:hypothetical protein
MLLRTRPSLAAVCRPSALSVLAIVLITTYGALLRLDAYVARHGALTHPRWAAVLTGDVAALGTRVRPFPHGWERDADPYGGGDPSNYLRFAREMRSFYQAHVREPMFLALTRAYLWLLGNQDGAVSFASMTGSLLIIVGAWLLASMFVPRWFALLPAVLIAIEYEFITWGMYGWRDDLFTATVVFTAWAVVRVHRAPTIGNALLLGVLAAASCLTRLSALSFIVPALVWLVVDGHRDARWNRLRSAAAAALVTALLVAPFLINCWRVTGDPFFAVNYHTIYYRAGEGMATDAPMSARAYIAGKFARAPVTTVDTAIGGLFFHPFASKWGGLRNALDGAATIVMWLAVVGLIFLAARPGGRALLLIILTSLVPYAFTWNVAGGGEWRFTMHVYPLYLVASVFALWRVTQLRRPSRAGAAWAGAAALVTLAIVGSYYVLPWFVVRESVAAGQDVNIEAGRRDYIFFADGWTAPQTLSVTTRVSDAERSTVRFPLPEKRAYDIVLRLDPAAAGEQRRLNVLLNGHFVALFNYSFDAQRIGTYRFQARAEQVNAGINRLTLIPDRLVSAGAAGERFAALAPDAQVGVRLWYVRVLGRP